MLKSGRNGLVRMRLCADGCSCCNSKQERRKVKKILKRREERQVKKDMKNY